MFLRNAGQVFCAVCVLGFVCAVLEFEKPLSYSFMFLLCEKAQLCCALWACSHFPVSFWVTVLPLPSLTALSHPPSHVLLSTSLWSFPTPSPRPVVFLQLRLGQEAMRIGISVHSQGCAIHCFPLWLLTLGGAARSPYLSSPQLLYCHRARHAGRARR